MKFRGTKILIIRFVIHTLIYLFQNSVTYLLKRSTDPKMISVQTSRLRNAGRRIKTVKRQGGYNMLWTLCKEAIKTELTDKYSIEVNLKEK